MPVVYLLWLAAACRIDDSSVPLGEPEAPCAEIAVSAGSLAWAGVPLGTPSAQSLSVRNPCDVGVVVEAAVDGPAFALSQVGLALEPGATSELVVTFSAFDGAGHAGTLTLTPAGGEALAVALAGVADADADDDGHADPRAGGDDCDDADPAIHPDATETCDGLDEDCDGVVDDATLAWFFDADGDGWGSGAPVAGGCVLPGYVHIGGDCDDAEALVHPGATEVGCDGVDQDCDGTVGTAALVGTAEFSTIQEAIRAASGGDTVEICPGTWTEALSVAKAITLTSRSGDPSDTVLDGEGDHRILTVATSGVAVSHLSFVRGSDWVDRADGGASGDGGAISASADLDLFDCVFTDNRAGYSGGAVALAVSGTSTIEDCVFTGNEAGYEGGGLTAGASTTTASLRVSGCTFAENTSGYEGGGLSWGARNGGTLTVETSEFRDNAADYSGGGAAIGGWDPATILIDTCTFDSNESGYEGGGLSLGSWAEGDDYRITDTTFVSNASRSGGAIDLGTWGWADLTVSGSSFLSNEAESGAAVELGSWATWVDARFTDTTFDGNAGASGASVFTVGSRITSCAVLFDTCTLTSNTSPRYAAVMLPKTCDLESDDTDWGSSTSDNTAHDLCAVTGCDDTLAASETFTCVAGRC